MVFKKSNEQTMREAIQSLLSTYRLNAGIDKVNLQSIWEKMMGPALAKRARLLSLRDGQLIIKVDSASLRQELSLAKTKIAERLNEEIGCTVVKEVVIV